MMRPWIRWFIVWFIVSVVAVALAHLADPLVWRAWRMPDVYEKDWGRLLRILGYLPTWGALALAYWLQQRGQPGAGRAAGYLALAPTLGGIAAELIKLLVRRLRPDDLTFGYAFRAFSDHPWSNRGMGMPSSHTLVAVAGAVALARVFPRAAGVFYVLAAGCAVTRVMADAHFLSDTVVAACVGYAVAVVLAHRMGVERGDDVAV